MTGLFTLFLFILVILGAIYVNEYEEAPLNERIQIFGVGFGIYIGIILLLS